MARLVISNEAREDMVEIWAHIAANNEGAADRVIASFREGFTTLAENPMVGHGAQYSSFLRRDLVPRLRQRLSARS